MNILLDTHFILWILFADSIKITPREANLIENPGNEIICSTVSFFEISLKFSLGKLELNGLEPSEIPALIQENGYQIEEPSAQIMASMHQLSIGIHRDPFDRILIWQAIGKKHHFLTKDARAKNYKNHGLKLA